MLCDLERQKQNKEKMSEKTLNIGDYRMVFIGDVITNTIFLPSIEVSFKKRVKQFSLSLGLLCFTGTFVIENRYAYEDYMDDVFDKISVGLAKQIHEYYERNYLNKK